MRTFVILIQAQYELARRYQDGADVPQDSFAAVQWFTKVRLRFPKLVDDLWLTQKTMNVIPRRLWRRATHGRSVHLPRCTPMA